jgi:serine/threonine protein kinase
MNEPLSTPDAEDAILGQFVRELESTADREALVRRYAEQYPALAGEFQPLAALNRMMQQPQAEAPALPPRLGEFRILRKIAQGGMGEVYEAEQERLRRRVAVKVIRHGRISGQARARFLREQMVLARLHQTHIVPIHTAGEEGPLQYFAMPFIEGAPLHHVVRTAFARETAGRHSKTPTLGELASLTADSGADVEPDAQPSEAEAGPLTLSPEYFRSVAQVMVDAAEALHHAHGAQILHRDLKPSNVMVDTAGQCWIIDFGLAGYLTAAEDDGRRDLEPATDTGVLGTPQYMAPEQFQGRADVRSDVWGLGVTLYELLTLRPAFAGRTEGEIRDRILQAEPPSPCQRVRNLPVDLAAVCRKALRKEPTQRYQTAQEFAEDLRRWLRYEPVRARPSHLLRRVALWCRRNRGWSTALAISFVALIGLMGAGLLSAEERARNQQREARLLELQQLRLGRRVAGWSDQAWGLVREVVRLRKGDDIRDQVVAMLDGLDGRRTKQFRHGASALAWDAAGKRLLMGAAKKGTAGLWEEARDEVIRFEHTGEGPVAFQADGTPVQLVADPKNRWSVALWDMDKGRPLGSFLIPPGSKAEAATALNPVLLAMTGDGRFVAAATFEEGKDGRAVRGHFAAWEAGTGRLLAKAEAKVTALGLSPDGRLLAAADEDGRIRLWSLAEGKELEPLHSGRLAVHALAFGRNPHRPETRSDDSPTAAWLLASGEEGGTVVVWDLRTRRVKSRCHSAAWDVSAVAFSPDGTTLASAGRGSNLWDVATGRLLLTDWGLDEGTSVEFSADGRRLAVSSDHPVPGNSDVAVYELRLEPELQTLRGLVGCIARIRFSSDNRWVAALSFNWQVALWDSRTRHLLHVFEVPKGLFADNADFCFSPDGSRLAFVTGRQA